MIGNVITDDDIMYNGKLRARKKRIISEETKAKMSEARLKYFRDKKSAISNDDN